MSRRFYLILLLLALCAPARAADYSVVSADRPAEYMIYQYPDVSMVVKVDVPETEFDSRITGPERTRIKSSGVPERRIGPIYQFVDSHDIARQLMIQISPSQEIDRERIGLELIQLPAGDRNSAALAQAYKLLSIGTETVHSSDTATWAMKAHTLRNAAQAFANLGWEEMRLWSEFYSAHLVLHQLNDALSAIEFSREIQRLAQRAGFEMIELAALVLESQAIMKIGGNASGRQAQEINASAHVVLERLAALAGDMGLQSERVRALYSDGIAYERQGDLQEAIGRYRQALEISGATVDHELVNQIRATAASVYESLGSTSGAIEMLENIAGDLSSGQTGELDEEYELKLADSLFEKGRLLNRSYRYREAVPELARALRIQRADAAASPWGPTGLALGWSYYSQGYMDQAVGLTEESLSRTTREGNSDTLFRAYGSLANIHRAEGAYEQMQQYREQQGSLAGSDAKKARYLLEAGLDAWRRDGPRGAQAPNILARSRRAAASGVDPLTLHRAVLYHCLLQLERNATTECSSGKTRSSYLALQNSGIPRIALDAGFAWSRIRAREGRTADALERLGRLIDEIRFFRVQLPGVLGAWYWENRTAIFSEYLAATLGATLQRGRQSADGAPVLLALERVRSLESASRRHANGAGAVNQDNDALRSLLARREAMNAAEASTLAKQVVEDLESLRKTTVRSDSDLDANTLARLLGELGEQDSILSYYFTDDAVYALPGDRNGVRLRQLSRPGRIRQELESLRQQPGQTGAPASRQLLDSLGSLMLAPVSGQLGQRIYLVPAGPLNGLPFDALRLDGEFLAESHRVVNLRSLSALRNRHPVLPDNFRDRVFLAGNPQSNQALFNYEISSSAEIGAVTDIFVGPGLHLVQGVALQRDEFLDQRFSEAAVIHMAMPGTVDLAFPNRSRLMLSGTGDNPGGEFLTPRDLQIFDFSDSLAVLSGTAIAGGQVSDFDSHLGLVSDFLDAGAMAVVASLWPAGDVETARFMDDFYRKLEDGQDVATALESTRKMRIEAENGTNLRTWAGFQLFIR
jgi:CHAT domain-containing protein